MRLYVNELSFEGQAKDEEDALALLLELVKTIETCQSITHNKGYIQKEKIKGAKIFGEITVGEFIIKQFKVLPHETSKLTMILGILLKGKEYNPNKHTDGSIVDATHNDLKGSCLDAASISKCGAVIVSLSNSSFSQKMIDVDSSISGKRQLLNITSAVEAAQLAWVYEPNLKHKSRSINTYKYVISPMDLNQDQAQHVLSNGVFINKRVYSYNSANDSWYCFPLHTELHHHGYKIDMQENVSEHSLAKKILSRVEFQMRGQIFADCWWSSIKSK